MNDWLRVVFPLVITALAIILYDMHGDIVELEKRSASAEEYIYRIERLEAKVETLQVRGSDK